jgi:hypothetical protein
MKTTNYLLSALMFVMTLSTSTSNAQDTIQDPLRKFDMFFENSLSINATRINTNHTEFSTSNGDYTFKKNDYRPTFDFNVNFGWLLNKKDIHGISSIKTGYNFTTRSADLLDPDGNELRLTTNYLMIPVQYSIRQPIKFNTVKNNLYRAIEYSAGFYVSSPFYQKLDHKNNIDSEGKYTWFNYLKFGFVAEVAYTAFNEDGNGHKFGIRCSRDFTSITKFSDTENELYPYYLNIGVFYNISNDYHRRTSN